MKNLMGLIALFVATAFAQSPAKISVQSSVDRQKVGIGDELVYSVSIVSDQPVQIQNPRPPDLAGFELRETWEKSSMARRMVTTPHGMDWEDQRTVTFNYRLRATAEGRQSIGAFEVIVNGKTYTTQPMVMNISKQSQGTPPGDDDPFSMGYPQGPSFDAIAQAERELFEQLLRRRQSAPNQGAPSAPSGPEPQFRSLPKNPNEAFFIQVEVDKTEVFEGEQVTASWYVYTRGQMETLDRVKFPSLKGFWKEIIEEVPTIQFSEEIVNGVVYRKALLASHALFPIKAGTAVIDEYKIKSRIRTLNQGFGGMGLGKAYEYTKSSQRVPIKVKPLPLEGRPASFTGAVGQFSVNAIVDTQKVLAQQPFTFRVRFEGAGNAKTIDLPAIQWPEGIEVYDTKSDSKFFKNGRSFKEFEVLLIPRADGELEIPAFEFAFFDPATEKYTTQNTEAIRLTVTPNDQVNSQGELATGRTGSSKGLGVSNGARPKQLPQLVMAYSYNSIPFLPVSHPIFWAAIYFGIIGLLGWKVHSEFGTGKRQKELRETFDRRWKLFEKNKSKKNHREIGSEVLNLFYLIVGSVAGEKGSSEEVSRMLDRVSPSIRREFGEEISKKIEFFQILSFAPDEAMGELKRPERIQKEISESKKLLNQLVDRITEVENGKE